MAQQTVDKFIQTLRDEARERTRQMTAGKTNKEIAFLAMTTALDNLLEARQVYDTIADDPDARHIRETVLTLSEVSLENLLDAYAIYKSIPE
jgi:hypothetical protein